MASIDESIGAMVQSGAPSTVLESDVAENDIRLLDALREVAPPSLAFLLEQEGQVNFPYASPWGTVSIVAERRSGRTRASITPSTYASSNVGGPPIVFAPPRSPAPVEWASEPTSQSFSPYAAASPIPAPDSAPLRAQDDAPRVGCLPAAVLSLLCVLVVNAVTRALGDGAGLSLVALSSVAVLIDAHKIGARQGKLGGLANMGPWGWFFACFLLWGVGMPYYLLARPLLLQARDAEEKRRPPWS